MNDVPESLGPAVVAEDGEIIYGAPPPAGGWHVGPPVPDTDPAGAAIGRCEAAELAADRAISEAERSARIQDALVI